MILFPKQHDYDTGSLGYTNDPIAGLNFLNSLLKVN